MALAGERHDVARDEIDRPPDPSEGPTLVHQPALDGLRGVAVAAVVLFHLGRLDGGFMGVDLFFVLSGFLITSLLVVERDRTGRIDLRRFWARRARRLLPALFLLLVGVAVLLIVFTPPDDRPLFRGDALATLGYVANWHRMNAEVSYWDMFVQPSPLDHTWSLAIEEQFYIVWPVLVIGAWAIVRSVTRRLNATGHEPSTSRFPRAVVALMALAGGAASFALLAWHYDALDTNRAYFATDSRIGPTLLGAALAAGITSRTRGAVPASPTVRPSVRRGLDYLVGAALAWIMWALATGDGSQSWYYRGGLVVFTLAALVVIAGVTSGAGSRVAQLLTLAPLRGLGLISYGVYLWHWPVIVYLDPDHRRWLPLTGLGLDGLRVAVTLVLALGSYHLLEQPIRRGALGTSRRAPDPEPDPVLGSVTARRRLRGWVLGGAAALGTTAAVLVATGGSLPDQPDPPSEGLTSIVLPDDAAAPAESPRIILAGDSGARALGPGLMSHGETQGVLVATLSSPQCTVIYPEGAVRHSSGRVVDNGHCQEERRTEWGQAVAEFTPDIVVYYLANAGMTEYRLDERWVEDCDPAYERYLSRALTEDVAMFSANGARVVVLTTPYPVRLDQDPTPHVDCRNQLFEELREHTAGVELVDLHAFVGAALADHGAETMLSDWVHFSEEGALVVSEWLLPQLIDP